MVSEHERDEMRIHIVLPAQVGLLVFWGEVFQRYDEPALICNGHHRSDNDPFYDRRRNRQVR